MMVVLMALSDISGVFIGVGDHDHDHDDGYSDVWSNENAMQTNFILNVWSLG